jgi:hypothetical protein
MQKGRDASGGAIMDQPRSGGDPRESESTQQKLLPPRAFLSKPTSPTVLQLPFSGAPNRSPSHEEGGGCDGRQRNGHVDGPARVLPRAAAPGADAEAHKQPVPCHHGQGRRAPAFTDTRRAV